MDTIQELLGINFYYVFVSVFTILAGIKASVSIFEWVADKLGLQTKWMRKREEERILIKKTSDSLTALQNQQQSDREESVKHDRMIQQELNSFMSEMRDAVSHAQESIQQFAENRLHDREQSLRIQKELKDAIKTVTDGEQIRDGKINALVCGNKELLGAEIDKRYRQYVSLDGIPEPDIDEFDDIYSAYKNLNGNHSRDTKYNYVKDHLPVIPVETRLVHK